MISAQNIREKKFVKAVFGGFEINSVEAYIDQIADEFTLLQKENIALKQKLKEVTEKNEEYKTVENSMRKALISAQSIANDMIEKANEERDRILNEASEIAHEQINTYRKQIAEEQKTLLDAQEKSAKFMSAITAFYEKQIKEVIGFSKEVPTIQVNDTKNVNSINIDDFTLDFANEKKPEINKIIEDKGYTADILEKIKKETLNPKTLSDISSEDTKKLMSDDYLTVGATSGLESDHGFSSIEKRNSKFEISELEFGQHQD